MLNRIATPFTKLVERYLPDPFIFVILLTLITFCAASIFTPFTSINVLQAWGNGFWNLLSFAMQMLLVLITGYMLASTPPISKVLEKLATLANTAPKAIILVTLISLLASWLNWGFGLVIGALFAKAIAKHTRVDYRLLVASAYTGFVVWHGGLAGSIPLTIATPGHFSQASMGIVSTDQTLFAGFNIAILIGLFIIVPLVNRYMLPSENDSIYIDPNLLNTSTPAASNVTRPAQHLEQSKLLGMSIGLMGLAYLGYYFFIFGGGLNLNSVIALFLFLAITLHQTPHNVLNSLQQAIPSGAGIVIQFPFYAGIMAVMVDTGLAQQISQGFIAIADADSLPFYSFISAGLVNMFVPSGGGQWAVQAPIVIPAAQELGADISRVAMAVAWGDAWTNLIQPFWALPVLAIAGLKAKDIMGFCVVQLFVTGVFIALMLSFYP
ncbi:MULTISPECIES: TIGR00366 family protein [unclassified Pseudoalteromonas]|uniref:short-chain fatty acid transporter n=1 Tax=unclassified Pseudoalteromonas TaxID=194690 RepID=UPI001107C95F|nr:MULTISPECIES: TIGR00366 family protein [unclassified Pseudoalteromonas]TMN83743.1 short-chain fatty acid transporter [Pseudoalteromonas sp. S410]TMN91682.1 short-chain fatty acid transporter [Pseudoalteromonas sp. S408]TMN96091.1 short-chain fatty acid transporter [Pseudoalteromonas sp. S407]TMO02672.1 short-chain fatty acid transporter [Pseudoalteromonas sp. S409]TMO12898.1 short-chain fatty acid transporter [Pseudoalteromonas sp. S186]